MDEHGDTPIRSRERKRAVAAHETEVDEHGDTPIRSRERKRAVAGAKLEFVRLEHGHGIPLLPNDILYGRRNVLWFP